jgi:hypothetical protein
MKTMKILLRSRRVQSQKLVDACRSKFIRSLPYVRRIDVKSQRLAFLLVDFRLLPSHARFRCASWRMFREAGATETLEFLVKGLVIVVSLLLSLNCSCRELNPRRPGCTA